MLLQSIMISLVGHSHNTVFRGVFAKLLPSLRKMQLVNAPTIRIKLLKERLIMLGVTSSIKVNSRKSIS